MILKDILPVMAVSVIMILLFAASKGQPKKDELGNIILKLPKFYSIFGILVILGGIGFFIFAFFFAKENDQLTIVIIGLVAMLSGLFLFAKGYVSHIKVTELGIIETTIFGKQKEIKWNEIEDLSFGKVSLELKIASSNVKIKAHTHLVGFNELVSKLEEKTGKKRIEFGIPG